MILAVATLLVAGCKKDKGADTTPACVGEWHLTNIAVKSVTYAGQTVDVYLSLQDGGTLNIPATGKLSLMPMPCKPLVLIALKPRPHLISLQTANLTKEL